MLSWEFHRICVVSFAGGNYLVNESAIKIDISKLVVWTLTRLQLCVVSTKCEEEEDPLHCFAAYHNVKLIRFNCRSICYLC